MARTAPQRGVPIGDVDGRQDRHGDRRAGVDEPQETSVKNFRSRAGSEVNVAPA